MQDAEAKKPPKQKIIMDDVQKTAEPNQKLVSAPAPRGSPFGKRGTEWLLRRSSLIAPIQPTPEQRSIASVGSGRWATLVGAVA
jgi:hypothetical protein